MSSKSVTAEMLRRRRDIPDAEVEALVERAALLQERAHDRQENHATEAEIAEVAAELDIAPEYVEQAITAWRTEKTSGPINPANPRILARRKDRRPCRHGDSGRSGSWTGCTALAYLLSDELDPPHLGAASAEPAQHPYPSTAYLARALADAGRDCTLRDLGLEMMLRVFSAEGIGAIFDELETRDELPEPAWRALALRAQHSRVVTPSFVSCRVKTEPSRAASWMEAFSRSDLVWRRRISATSERCRSMMPPDASALVHRGPGGPHYVDHRHRLRPFTLRTPPDHRARSMGAHR